MQWMLQQAAQRTRVPMKTPRPDSGVDYDNQGAYLVQQQLSANGHGSDQFKKPNHPTFSDQSQYNGVAGNIGGTWGDGTYTPSGTNLGYRSQEELQRYFNQVEPDIKLLAAALRKGKK